jgi:exodeoxyribonuclease III
MKILSYNVAGLRAMLKKETFIDFINSPNFDYNIVCIQETKADESQVKLDLNIKTKFPYMYWNSTHGTTQRKGLSGVSIWCSYPPTTNLGNPDFDEEGRILSLEFEDFIIVNVYVPNSQKFESERYFYRTNWNNKFITYIDELKMLYKKNIIICGDLNVAHTESDITNPKAKKNKVAGFFDIERKCFNELLNICELVDIYRHLNPSIQKSTYWSNFLKAPRSQENGWGIDYFLISKSYLANNEDKMCSYPPITMNILMNICGSDHCPIELIIGQ